MNNEEVIIWNRACMKLGSVNPREGDVALAALLGLHSPAMNGGLSHSCEFLGPSRCAAAIEGFRYFDLNEMALLVERAMHLSEEESEELDDQYFDLVPQDNILVEAFLRKRTASPEAFAPVHGVVTT